MTTNDVIEHDATTSDTRTDAFVGFLRAEFPEWTFDLEKTETWGGAARPLWIGTKPGHHPQSALTAGKLHRRISDYEERVAARHPESN